MISDETGKEMKDLGPAVTVGSGVPLNILYEETKKLGRFYVGGSAATVALAGGYVQGTGHSAFSPVFGLGADNALGEFGNYVEMQLY
jgi:FAD/FMN-containing dehydrogenase